MLRGGIEKSLGRYDVGPSVGVLSPIPEDDGVVPTPTSIEERDLGGGVDDVSRPEVQVNDVPVAAAA